MNTNRQQILKWQQQGHIDNNDIDKALIITESNNPPKAWYDFISQSILWLAVLSIAFGVIFFFAYNWNEITKLTKFILIQGLMLISLLTYSQTKTSTHANTAVLFFLALLIGSLFALFGQTYQTGKDPWQLFFIWAVCITPLALTSRSSSLWLLWLALVNLTLYLYLGVRFGLLGLLFDHERQVLFYAFVNVSAAAMFEYLYHSKYKLLNNRIVVQVALLASMFCFSWIALYYIFESKKHGLDIVFYLIWMGAVYFLYRVKTIDVLVLTAWVVSCIMFALAMLARVIKSDLDGGTFLLFSLLIVGLSTIGIKWLMSILKEIKQKGDVS